MSRALWSIYWPSASWEARPGFRATCFPGQFLVGLVLTRFSWSNGKRVGTSAERRTCVLRARLTRPLRNCTDSTGVLRARGGMTVELPGDGAERYQGCLETLP